MKKARTFQTIVFLAMFITPCFAHHIAVVVNKSNKVQGISSAQLAKIFKLETRKWPDGTNVVLVLHKSSPDEITTLERLNGMTSAQVHSFLSTHKDVIRMVDSDADIIETVSATPGAAGLIEARSITNQVNVVKIDGKLPLEAGYLPH